MRRGRGTRIRYPDQSVETVTLTRTLTPLVTGSVTFPPCNPSRGRQQGTRSLNISSPATLGLGRFLKVNPSFLCCKLPRVSFWPLICVGKGTPAVW